VELVLRVHVSMSEGGYTTAFLNSVLAHYTASVRTFTKGYEIVTGRESGFTWLVQNDVHYVSK